VVTSVFTSSGQRDTRVSRTGSVCPRSQATGWIPGLDAVWPDGGWHMWAAQTLGAPGRSASVRAAAVMGLAAVQGGGGASRVVDRVRLARIRLRPAGCDKNQAGRRVNVHTEEKLTRRFRNVTLACLQNLRALTIDSIQSKKST